MTNFYEEDRIEQLENTLVTIEEKIQDDMYRFIMQIEDLWEAIDRLQNIVDRLPLSKNDSKE